MEMLEQNRWNTSFDTNFERFNQVYFAKRGQKKERKRELENKKERIGKLEGWSKNSNIYLARDLG